MTTLSAQAPVRVVPIEALADTWPKVEEWLRRAVEEGQGDENILDVFIAIARGAYALWVAETFAAVVSIVRNPRQVVATILYCGGRDLNAITQVFEWAKHYARAQGIDVIRVWGRPGWVRALELERIGVILQLRV